VIDHPARTFWIVAVCTLLLDQLSKAAIRILWDAPSALAVDDLMARFVTPAYGPYESVPIIGRVFMLTHVRNTGAAFGLLPGYQPIFIATSIVVLIVVAGYWRKARPSFWPVVVALGLIAGGAVGNLIDRAILGRVTDFLYLAAIDFPVFNIADSAIVVGVGILIVWLLFVPEQEAAAEQASVEPREVSATHEPDDAAP